MNQSDCTGKKNDHGKGIRQTRKDRAILALLQHNTIERAAASINVHPATLYRWMQESDFRDKLAEASNAVYFHGLTSLKQAVRPVANRLLELATSKDTPPAVALAACNSLLDRADRSSQLDQLHRLPTEDPGAVGEPFDFPSFTEQPGRIEKTTVTVHKKLR